MHKKKPISLRQILRIKVPYIGIDVHDLLWIAAAVCTVVLMVVVIVYT